MSALPTKNVGISPFMRGERGTTGGMVESPNMTGTGTVMMPEGSRNLTGGLGSTALPDMVLSPDMTGRGTVMMPEGARNFAGVSDSSSNDSSSGFNINLNPLNLLSMYAGDYLSDRAAEDFLNLGSQAAESASQLAQEVATQSQFKPFTVKTGSGSQLRMNQEGGYDVVLSPEEQARQAAMFTQAGQLFDFAATDPSQSTQGFYEMMRSIQTPEEERKRLALEERMLSQGRLGLQSAAYGGSNPELLAQAQAIEEAKRKSLLSAREMAMGERKQAYDLGLGMLSGSYLPQQEALAALGYGLEGGKLADIGRRTGAELYGQAGQTGIEAMLNASKLAASMEAQGRASLAQDIFGSGGLFSGGENEQALDFNFDFDNPDLSDSEKLSKALEYYDVLKEISELGSGYSGNQGYVTVEEIIG